MIDPPVKSTNRSRDSTLLLATYSANKQLRCCRVRIDFQQMKFDIQHVKTANCGPPLDQHSNSHLAKSCRISHLEFVSPGPKNPDPFILVVFSQIPDHYQDTGICEEPFSIFSRWELRSASPTLHPSFEQLTSKNSNISSSGDRSVRVNIEFRKNIVC